MGLITQPTNITMARDSYISPYYREMASCSQRNQQIDTALNRLFSLRNNQDGVSIRGLKEARTEAERAALRNIYDAGRLSDKYDNGLDKLLYGQAIVNLGCLDRGSYTLEEYVSLQELKVSCQWFLAQNTGIVGQMALRVYDLQLADLYKELGKGNNANAPLYLLRSAQLRIQCAKDFYDTEQAMGWLNEAITDLAGISKTNKIGKSFYDMKIQLLTLARGQIEALKNPSLIQRVGNTFQGVCEWIVKWGAGPIL